MADLPKVHANYEKDTLKYIDENASKHIFVNQMGAHSEHLDAKYGFGIRPGENIKDMRRRVMRHIEK